jgi:hypothetical protein
MEKFWLVWSTQGGAPTLKHMSHESACREAERLARNNPGKRFEVMERVSSVIKQDVQWEGEQSIPF